MKLFLIGAIALASASEVDAHWANYESDNVADAERSIEAGIGDLSSLDLVLASAVNQALSSTVVPVFGLAGGFTRSAASFLASLTALRPNTMLPGSFYSIVADVIQGFADPVSGRISDPVSMDDFLQRLRDELTRQSVVDFDAFHRVCDNLKKIVILYPFVTTGAYLTYLSQLLSTLQNVLNAATPNPTAAPATIPLAPATHPMPLGGFFAADPSAEPTSFNTPNLGWIGNLEGGLLKQLKANLLQGLIPFPGTALNPIPIAQNIQLQSPLFTGINTLGALEALKIAAKTSLLDPFLTFTEGVDEESWNHGYLDHFVPHWEVPTTTTATAATTGATDTITEATAGTTTITATTGTTAFTGTSTGGVSPALEQNNYSTLPTAVPMPQLPVALPVNFSTATAALIAASQPFLQAKHNFQQQLLNFGNSLFGTDGTFGGLNGINFSALAPQALLNHPVPPNLAAWVQALQQNGGVIHPWLLARLNNAGVATFPTAAPVGTTGTQGTGVTHPAPPFFHPVHPNIAAAAQVLADNGGIIHPRLAARLAVTDDTVEGNTQVPTNLHSGWYDQNQQNEDVEGDFVWSLPDASVYFLQRLDLLRPVNMAPANFLQAVNNTIESVRDTGALAFQTPASFVKLVAEQLENRMTAAPEAVNNVSVKIESALNGPFPAFPDILQHINRVITEKLGA